MAALAHVVLLGVGGGAVRQWQRDQLQAKPVSTPAVLKVRHLSGGAVLAPNPVEKEVAPPRTAVPASAPAPQSPSSAPQAQQQEASAVEPAVYVPRAMLSVPPVARKAVLLQWPPNWPLRRTYTAVLKLYLDESGRVERVEPDGDAVLPEPLFESARDAFLAAEFSAGQLNGQAVKSWIRVEVSFETGDRPGPP